MSLRDAQLPIVNAVAYRAVERNIELDLGMPVAGGHRLR